MRRTNSKRIGILVNSFIVFCLFPLLVYSAVSDRRTGEFYMEEYGVVEPVDNLAAKHAHIIFNKLLNASDIKQNLGLRLIVLPRNAANWENWAMSLADGTIVLIESVLDLCFESNSIPSEKGKARLAFILAHELSHLMDEHHKILARNQSLKFQQESATERLQSIKTVESRADYSGLVLMTMADFEPRFLIDQSNFFQEYVSNVRNHVSFDEHYPPNQRMRVLKGNLKPLIDEMPLFVNGIRHYKKKNFSKAVESFERFAEIFPGREVYNNLGLSYLQQSLRYLAETEPKNLFRFMLSTAIDSETLAVKLIPDEMGKTRGLNSRYQQLLRKAEENLVFAIQKDILYVPARINLSSVKILQKKYDEALVIVEDVLKLNPLHPDALNNKAIALYLDSPKENAVLAMTLLKAIKSRSRSYSYRYARYNATRIQFEKMNCFEKEMNDKTECLSLARKSWSPFLQTETNSVYARLVNMELGKSDATAERQTEKKRVALVLGNSTYSYAPLLNPLNDANAIAKSLKKLGFKTIVGLDLTREEMLLKIDQFGEQLTSDSTGLLYYSGHGFQIRGENFLLPIGEDVEAASFVMDSSELEETIRNGAVSLNIVLERMRLADNVQNIVILDSCRNNPISDLGEDYRGFAELNAPPRTYVAYSTAPGQLAWDGLDGNFGVFTQSLLDHIEKTNIDIQNLFQTVRKEVSEKSSGYQTTWDISTLDQSYYFNPPIEQDWTWHITAGVVAALAAWKSMDEAKNYRKLNEDNEKLLEKYGDNINLEEYFDIRQQYYVNQEKMKSHKQTYEILDVVTVAAVIWGAYLLAFETYDEGQYDDYDTKLKPEVVAIPNPRNNTVGLSLQWKW